MDGTTPIRFGIVGGESDRRAYAEAFAQQRIPDGRLGAESNIEGASELFCGDIQAVICCVPNHLQPSVAMEAFRRGLHVLIDFPAGAYTRQVLEMNEAAALSGCRFGMANSLRGMAAFAEMRRTIAAGTLGALRRTVWTGIPGNVQNLSWRHNGGGILMQNQIMLDIWQWVCGMPVKVTAFCRADAPSDLAGPVGVEHEVAAHVEYENGATGLFSASDAAFSPVRMEAVCEGGYLSVDGSGNLHCYDAEGARLLTEWADEPAGAEAFAEAASVNNFIDCILGRGEPTMDGREGLHALALANAMYLSSWLGKTVPLPADPELYLKELRKKYK